MRSCSKAFTLIELLVVIAIIAILAAILFPVFAQAKAAAKKSVALSNTKQAGTAVAIYLSDSDDTYPLMHPIDPATGAYLHTNTTGGRPQYRLASIPAGWGVNAPFQQTDAVQIHNSVQPYSKNADIFGAQGLNVWTSGFNYATAPANLPVTSLGANGLLNQWSATAVATPSQLPLWVWNNGKEAYRGYAYTPVYLRCNDGTPPIDPCVFNPGGKSQAGSTAAATARQDTYELTFEPANDTTWVFGEGWIYVACDTSAKWTKQPMEGRNNGNYTQAGLIYTRLAQGEVTIPGGSLDTPLRCVSSAGAPPYMSFFRPDSTFQYRFGASGDAVPCFP